MVSGDGAWTDPQCPVARAVDLVGDRWSLLIVRDAFDGVRRFTQFQRSLGVARNILSERLRALVERGVLAQVPNSAGTRTEYELTDRGRDLFTIVVGLRQWAERHAFAPGERHSVLIDDTRKEPTPLLQLVNTDGVALDAATTHVRRVDPDEPRPSASAGDPPQRRGP